MKGFALFILLTTISFTACSTPRTNSPSIASSPTPPQVTINSPANTTPIRFGNQVIVQSTSTDADGVARVDLLVDGQTVQSDTNPSGSNPTQFRIAQVWQATTPGAHLMTVRATDNEGIPGEASLVVTVTDAPTPTETARPTATFAPTSTPIPPTPTPLLPSATPAPSQFTITLTEAQVSTMIDQVIASTQPNSISITGVSLQNGQMTANTLVKGPFGVNLNGRLVVTVTASNCDVRATVIEATAGPLALTEEQKEGWNRAIEELIRNQLSATQKYSCIDSIAIANGAMTIKFH